METFPLKKNDCGNKYVGEVKYNGIRPINSYSK